MLTNLPNYQVSNIKVLAQLAESKINFHLTGSRYFGNATQLSDWDFFVQDNNHVRDFLVSLGFKIEGQGTDYPDNQITFVYRHPDTLVDVQVVREALVKQVAQFLVDTKEIHRGNDLTRRNSAWNTAYKRARTIIQLVKWGADPVVENTDDVPDVPDVPNNSRMRSPYSDVKGGVNDIIPKRSSYTWADRQG